MGLDFVEFIIAVEDSFGLAIPDADAERLRTTRQLIGYLTERLPRAPGQPGCLSQRAFYQLRRATCARLGVDRRAIRPAAPLAAVFAGEEGRRAWEDVRVELGARFWPQIGPRPFLDRADAPHLETFGGAADFLVTRYALGVQEDGPGWTRAQVADVVRRLIRDELGVEAFTDDSRFIEDMGID